MYVMLKHEVNIRRYFQCEKCCEQSVVPQRMSMSVILLMLSQIHTSSSIYTHALSRVAVILILLFLFGLTPQIFKF